MHSYLFIGSDPQLVNKKVESFAQKSSGKLIEFEVKTIEQVREMKHFVGLSTNEKLFIHLPNIDHSSEAAQNALLKTLEEPQEQITFLLTAEIEEKVLPTIRSRCEVIYLKHVPNEEAIDKFKAYLLKSPGEKFMEISEINKREEAIAFLKMIIEGGSVAMKKNPSAYNVVENAQTTLHRIESNANVQTQLTNFVVQHLSNESD